MISFIRNLKDEFESRLTSVGKYYSKIIFNEDNYAQKLVSKMKTISPSTNYYRERFYLFYLLTKVRKETIKGELAKLLKKNYDEIEEGKFKYQIKDLYKGITTIELS